MHFPFTTAPSCASMDLEEMLEKTAKPPTLPSCLPKNMARRMRSTLFHIHAPKQWESTYSSTTQSKHCAKASPHKAGRRRCRRKRGISQAAGLLTRVAQAVPAIHCRRLQALTTRAHSPFTRQAWICFVAEVTVCSMRARHRESCIVEYLAKHLPRAPDAWLSLLSPPSPT